VVAVPFATILTRIESNAPPPGVSKLSIRMWKLSFIADAAGIWIPDWVSSVGNPPPLPPTHAWQVPDRGAPPPSLQSIVKSVPFQMPCPDSNPGCLTRFVESGGGGEELVGPSRE
jgi:hypothetical protein